MKPTPIKWLLEQLKVCNYISKKGYKNAETWLIQEALEYEKEQQNEFAIGFAEWLANSYYSYNFGIKMFQHRNKEIYKTTKELLEMYKTEKGL